MKNIYSEAQRGLNQVVTSTTSDTWVNKNEVLRKQDQRLAEQFRAVPLTQDEVGTTVKDRDLVDGKVDEPVIQEGDRVQNVTGDYDVEPVSAEDVDVVENPAFPPVETSDVPSGTIKKVLAWVGDDKDRAQAALDAENADESPRKSLVEKLEEMILTDEEEN